MISIDQVVLVVLFLLGAGAIFAILAWIIRVCEREFPDYPMFYKFTRIALAVLAGLVLIGLILDMMGHPLIVWRTVPDTRRP